MQVDGGIGFDPSDAVATAKRAEEDGFDGVWCAETGHDPFLPLLLAAEHTERVELGTGIAVAFARNPMSTAVLANDLQAFSKGRFMLGLGSQIKPHIEKRYSMPWSHPAARMREFIAAMRAIWAAWHDGTKLAFRGDFYTHTLMTPFFNPGPNPHGNPKVFLAAVGERMTEVAGEVADGLLAHGFTTARYMREVTIPALERGLAQAGRTRQGYEISYPAMMVTGSTDAEMQAAAQAVKAQLAFYASTPAYRPVLDLHGWGDLFAELNTRSKRGEWVEMADLIPDDMLDAFAVTGQPDEIPKKIIERYGDMVTRVSFYAPYRMERSRLRALLEGFRASGS
ncbi:MAG TPA: LLM class F420-dependent oxidoreductase [Acidimicrobiales bacterium]|nr:LLM class F420-dependent oxidoreductase [Acidimicrobiales bacterium]